MQALSCCRRSQVKARAQPARWAVLSPVRWFVGVQQAVWQGVQQRLCHWRHRWWGCLMQPFAGLCWAGCRKLQPPRAHWGWPLRQDWGHKTPLGERCAKGEAGWFCEWPPPKELQPVVLAGQPLAIASSRMKCCLVGSARAPITLANPSDEPTAPSTAAPPVQAGVSGSVDRMPA
ncbi:MAG: hypothetical protein RL700_2035 [Pseudomonadota bacterium]